MALVPELKACLTTESKDYCFHRLGELLFADQSKAENEDDGAGQAFKLAVASRHGWTVYAHSTSKAKSIQLEIVA